MGFLSTSNYFIRTAPHDLIITLKISGTLDTFIETGSYLGETAYWAEKNFKSVLSFEASSEYYKNLKSSNILKFVFADSSSELHKYLKNNSLIYLDAHYSGGFTHKSYPLISELSQINDSKIDNLVIIIDDARFCISKWNGESYGYIIDILNIASDSGKRYVCIFDDMIIAVPKYLSQVVDSWVLKRSSEYWNSFKFKNSFLKRIKYSISKKIK
jgi:hypothetical protein